MSTLLKTTAIIFLTFIILAILLYSSLAPVVSLRYTNPGLTTLMIERGGPVNQMWVPLSRISDNLRHAVVVAEDGNFYSHHGIDFHELQQSINKNLKKRKFSRGFSTITMQLAKNLYLSREKTVVRKFLEILIALQMERVLPKNRIFEIYLNVIEWGLNVYGAEAASQHYFHAASKNLTLDQAAFLAAILPNPRKWGHWPPGPYVNRRKKIILGRMGYAVAPLSETLILDEIETEPNEVGE